MARGGDIPTRGIPIVLDRAFAMATRETGYRDFSRALAELIDNSLQARARRIWIDIRDRLRDDGPMIIVQDDGSGMTSDALHLALQFGGSTRFNDRTGIGRFGMGLPNSSVSQARCVDVYSWRHAQPLWTRLDLDAIADGQQDTIPRPRAASIPPWVPARKTDTGTIVVWSRCDRLATRSLSELTEPLKRVLGRLYRYALWDGVQILVNDQAVAPFDPLFCRGAIPTPGGTLFGTPLRYEVGGGVDQSFFEVRFSELPVKDWLSWTTEQKRVGGVLGGAGVSVVRAGREIDYGWFLMGDKRPENYDNWWRCEIRFAPALDELFGVTHSKQGIRPNPELRRIVGSDLEVVARELNKRVRAAFNRQKAPKAKASQTLAESRDVFLPPPRLTNSLRGSGMAYEIAQTPMPTREFYSVRLKRSTVELTLNTKHPFFTHVYSPVVKAKDWRAVKHLEMMLFAVARADLEAATPSQRSLILRIREKWGDALATFLNS